MTVTITPYKNKRCKALREYLFIFSDCETLIQGTLFLYRLKLNFKSTLYKTENDYRLIIKCRHTKPYILCLNEFCLRQSRSFLEIAHTKEYGTLLISSNAVKTFGKYFSKDF